MRIWLSFLACSTLPRCTFFHFTICRERTEMTYLHRNQAIFLWKQRSKATAEARFWPYHQLWSISGSKLAVHRKAYLAANTIINLMKHLRGTKKSQKSRGYYRVVFMQNKISDFIICLVCLVMSTSTFQNWHLNLRGPFMKLLRLLHPLD